MSGSIRETLESKRSRFEELERLMSDPEVQGDGNRMSQIAREHGGLSRLVSTYSEFNRISDDISGLSGIGRGDRRSGRARDGRGGTDEPPPAAAKRSGMICSA